MADAHTGVFARKKLGGRDPESSSQLNESLSVNALDALFQIRYGCSL
jgi:hypothetical protein